MLANAAVESSLNRRRRQTIPSLPRSSSFDVPDNYSITIDDTPFLFNDSLVRQKSVILFSTLGNY
ncbi:unnamed protein product, partial [Rotaria sp. Silwood1]